MSVGYVPPTNPLRTKRNFKALVIDDTPPSQRPPPAVPAGPVVPAGKRRPPPIVPENTHGNLMPRPFDHGFPNDSPATGRRSVMLDKLAKLDLMNTKDSVIPKLELKKEDLKKLNDIGHGNGGSVEKVEHMPTGTIMAKKIVLIDATSSVRKQILRELQILHDCRSKYIISCFGSFLAEPNICICMEYMDKGSFDNICRKIGAIDINVVCLVAHSVLEGLCYLYDVHRIIHRDIKPSNILLNSQGQIKLCDFGVSGELINSIANTFVGTSIYMSPERLQGAEYSIKSDIWSLGISLVELATARFPFCDNLSDDDTSDLDEAYSRTMGSNSNRTPTHRDSFALNAKRRSRRQSKGGLNAYINQAESLSSMSIIELMHQIVREPAPRLEAKFGEEAQEFVDACLAKDPDERHGPKTLLEYRWMDDARDSTFDLKEWTESF